MAVFVDTNVLLYAASAAVDEMEKSTAARAILNRDDLVLSTQVLQEFYVQATRATKTDRLAHDTAVALIESWLRFRVVEITVPLVRQALATAARCGASRIGMRRSSRLPALRTVRRCCRRTCNPACASPA